MKPPRFAYHDPSTVEEAVSLLHALGPDARVLAGGQSLVPMLNMRLARPGHLIDINPLAELQQVRLEGGVLTVGAGCRQVVLEENPDIRRVLPLLGEVARHIGYAEIRHRGTVGGSMAHADPAAELPAAALALGAEFTVMSHEGERTIPADDFFAGIMMTALGPGDLLTGVRFPVPPEGTGWGFAEVARRHGDFALAAAVALVQLDEGGAIARGTVTLTGISDRPVRASELEQALVGVHPSDDELESLSRLVEDLVDVDDDMHSTKAYRRQVAAVMTRRALAQAVSRASEGEGEGR